MKAMTTFVVVLMIVGVLDSPQDIRVQSRDLVGVPVRVMLPGVGPHPSVSPPLLTSMGVEVRRFLDQTLVEPAARWGPEAQWHRVLPLHVFPSRDLALLGGRSSSLSLSKGDQEEEEEEEEEELMVVVGRLLVLGGKDLGEVLLRKGVAALDEGHGREWGLSEEVVVRYRRAQHKAQRKGAGYWGVERAEGGAGDGASSRRFRPKKMWREWGTRGRWWLWRAQGVVSRVWGR